MNKNIITGRNPVMEALRGGREIEKILIVKGAEGSIKKIMGKAKDLKVPVQLVEKSVIDRLAEGSNHQGVMAYVSEYEYCEVEDILQRAADRGEAPFVMVLDGLEDPHNLGAIMRTAEAFGVHGIVIPKRRAVGITDTVAKASAGAVEYMLCAKVSNVVQAIEKLKASGVWVYACDMGGASYYGTDLKGGIALVIGNEGSGISRLVKESCDFCISIGMVGKISSLNASNAAAILMGEVRRQRDGANS